jgi:hypothetical protein
MRTIEEKAAYGAGWYRENKQKVLQKRRARRPEMLIHFQQRVIEHKAFLNALKLGVPCADCQEVFPPVCIDFDHVRGEKIKGLSGMWSWSRSRILAELEKCELVCANCHRLRTEDRLSEAA